MVNHVTYLLLAEFDIAEGSVLRHQYPAQTGVDEHLLAEHMLPDGAHDRTDDWTIFYLNQIPALTVDPTLLKSSAGEEKPKVKLQSEVGKRRNEQEGGLLYVMSLVRTKKVATVRRGAMVKALAVATHNPYIQIYKPILLLALEDYFNDPSVACLQRLYQSLNAMDTTHLPHLSLDERVILRTSERRDVFEEKFADSEPPPYIMRHTPSNPSLSVSAAHSDESTEIIDAIDQHSLDSSGSLSSRASAAAQVPPGTAASSEETSIGMGRTKSRANTISSEDGKGAWRYGFPPRRDSDPQLPAVPSLRPKDTHWFDTKIVYSGHSLNIRVPLGTFPEEVGDYSLIKLVQIFSNPASSFPVAGPIHPHLHTSGPSTHPIILLFNALVTHKRVVFLGHGQPAGHVASLVLAACALGSGCGTVLKGFTERAFPYTNLLNLDNLETVPGFIAGVCNPAFADRPSWWDVLCNIETGKIIVSKDIEQPAASSMAMSTNPSATASLGRNFSTVRSQVSDVNFSGMGDDMTGAEFGRMPNPSSAGAGGGTKDSSAKGETPDTAFMDEISGIIQAHYGESVVRARFTDYAQRFVRLASLYEEERTGATTIGYPCVPFGNGALGSGVVFVDDTARVRDWAINMGRIEGWRLSTSYTLFQKSFLEELEDSPLEGLDFAHQISRLRQTHRMSAPEVELILKTLATKVQSDEQIVAILSHLPPHFGGLLPLAFGLFHPSESVRNYTLDFLDKVNQHPTGRKFIQSLNAFHRSAYLRLSQERPQLANGTGHIQNGSRTPSVATAH